MKILLLGYDTLKQYLLDHDVDHSEDHPDTIEFNKYDLIISYGYRYIIRKRHLDQCKRKPLNLHISYLPWNKGAHPNFWAWYDNTPHGVTIHEIDEGLDTGPIVCQYKVMLDTKLTLSESYDILLKQMELLFVEFKDNLLKGDYKSKPQTEAGSFHYVKDLPKFDGGWNQTIEDVKRKLMYKKIGIS